MTTELALPVVTDAAIGAVAATPELDWVRIEHCMFGEQGPTDPVWSATAVRLRGWSFRAARVVDGAVVGRWRSVPRVGWGGPWVGRRVSVPR